MINLSHLKKFYTNGNPYVQPPSLPIAKTSQQHIENVRRLYESSLEYRVSLPSYHVGYEYATLRLLELGEKHNLTSAINVVELCCGTGTTMVHLIKKYGFCVTGIDLVPEHIARCKQLVREESLEHKARLICSNILKLDSGIGVYDAIISEDAFSQVPDRHKLFSVCRKLLKPKGIMLFSDLIRTAHMSEIELREQCNAWCLYQPESIDSYKTLIRQAGFNILEAHDNLGCILLSNHIASDKQRGDIDPIDYINLFNSNESDLIEEWGRQVFEIRNERLKTYSYIWESKLDFAFFVLQLKD